MNRNYFTLFLLAALTLSLSFTTTSCKKDKESSPADLIVGEWYLANDTGFYYYEEDGEVKRGDYNDSFTKETTYVFLTFYSGGTGMVKYTEEMFNENDEQIEGFTWIINNDKLVFIGDEGGAEFTIMQLDSSTLKLQMKGTDSDGPYEETSIYKRV